MKIMLIDLPSTTDKHSLGKLSLPHCDLTGIMVNKGNHAQMACIYVIELLQFTQKHDDSL